MADRKKQRLYWTLWAVWAGVIFYFSAQPDTVSDEQSGVFARALEEVVEFISGPAKDTGALYALLDHIVRKAAHFMVYLILGALGQRAYWYSGAARPSRSEGAIQDEEKRRGWCLLLALLTGALYAATDELHQYFVPGRSMQLTDVLLDSAGVLCGSAAATFFLNVGRK